MNIQMQMYSKITIKLTILQLLERTQRRPFVSELSTTPEYVTEVKALKKATRELLQQLTQVLAHHRETCPRLHLVTNLQLAALIGTDKPATQMNKFLHQVSLVLSSCNALNWNKI